MLVLNRQLSEKIVIFTEDGTRIELVLVRPGLKTVRIGINAPKNVKIIRGELENGLHKTEEVPNGIGHQTVSGEEHPEEVSNPGNPELPTST